MSNLKTVMKNVAMCGGIVLCAFLFSSLASAAGKESRESKPSVITSKSVSVVKKPVKSVTNYVKYLCNGKTNALELHTNQPGYQTDGVCTTSMNPWTVCASIDTTLVGTMCMQPIIEPVYTKYLCNGKTNLLETHSDQPGYITDGVCTPTMDPWHVCASIDKNLAGNICHGGTPPGFNCDTVTDVSFQECQALVDLYHGTA
jgi:hypothetical protein